MTVTFLAPGFLWALAVIPGIWFLPRRVRDVRHGVLRSLLLAALVLGLARPVQVDAHERPRHVVVVDRSASAESADPATTAATLDRVLAAIPAGTERILLELGGTNTAAPARGIERVLRVEANGTSPLAAALALAAAEIPAGAPGAVTLISDGLATDTQWGAAFADLLERGIPLHTVPLARDEQDPRVVALSVEDTIRVGHTTRVQVRLAGALRDAQLTLRGFGETLAQREGIASDGPVDVELRFEPRAAGFHELRVELAASGDSRPGTNLLARRIAVQPPLRVLYLGHRHEGGQERLATLLGAGFVLSSPEAEAGPDVLDHHDVLVLDDRPANRLAPEWRRAIARAVRERGLGLLASGGRAAFGAGGYAGTEIEELLPIEFVQKEEKKDPSTTLAIIIDSSGSMVGNRMTLAKQVARLAMRRLQPHDKIGIVEFYGTKSWAAPIQSAANQIDLQRALNRLDAGGGTVLMPAIEEAYYAMKNVQTRYKHVLVLTDAGVESGDYESLLRRMADEGMTVSTVLVGPGRHSDFLVDLADWGGGRYYNAADRFNLPELLLKKPSTSVLPSYRPERVELEVAAGPGWWGELDMSTLPPLDGFVEAELKPGAELLLRTRSAPSPVLATRLHGLGRVTAFLSEPTGAGTRTWSEWPGYGALLGRVLARTARGRQEPFAYSLLRRGDALRLEARRLVPGAQRPECRPLAASGAEGEPLPLRERAPGVFRWEGRVPPDADFELVAASKAPDTGVVLARRLLVSGAREDVAPELQVDGSRAFPLARASALSGGLHVDTLEASFALPTAAGSSPVQLRRLWPWLVLLALILLAADVGYRRRVATPRESVR